MVRASFRMLSISCLASTTPCIQELATVQNQQTGVFAVSMSIFMCLAPPEVTQSVSANLYQYGQRSSAQVYAGRTDTDLQTQTV